MMDTVRACLFLNTVMHAKHECVKIYLPLRAAGLVVL